MTAIQFHFTGGDAFYVGAAVAVCGLPMMLAARRPVWLLGCAGIIVGATWAALAAAPVAAPLVVVIVASLSASFVLTMGKRRRRRLAFASTALAAASILFAIGMELRYAFCRGVDKPVPARRIYVIGDSISAWVGDGGKEPWPELLARQHDVQAVNLAVAGSTTASEIKHIERTSFKSGIVVIEIGGNDMFTKRPPATFEHDLDRLASLAAAPDRAVVMFEVPAMPGYSGYLAAQRRIAKTYHIALVPRRRFASLLFTPGATIADGIHLNQRGQQQMADLVWELTSSALPASTETGPSPTGLPD